MSKDANTRDQLQKIARQIDEELPENWGFMLFAFPFGEADGRLNYVAKCNREDAMRIIGGWLLKQGKTPEDFAKHIDDGIWTLGYRTTTAAGHGEPGDPVIQTIPGVGYFTSAAGAKTYHEERRKRDVVYSYRYGSYQPIQLKAP